MDTGPAVRHADAQLAMVERVLPRLLATLDFNAAYARLLRDACGTDPAQWDAADSAAREYVLAQGRLALLRAARVPRRAYDALPRNSRQRSDVLLKGAAKLGIVTGWPGWE